MPSEFPQGRVQANPGAALKKLRTQRGLTLADLSKLTGMNVSTLSKIENGKVALTLDKLLRVSEGLEVDMTELIGSGAKETPRLEGAARRSISRAGEGHAIEMPRGNYLYVAAELLNKRITPIIGDVLAKNIDEYGEFMRHPGEEYVYVLEGILELHTELYTPAILEKGDSVYFDSQMGHAYIAIGDQPCRILSICATSEPHLIDKHQSIAEAEHISEAARRTERKRTAR